MAFGMYKEDGPKIVVKFFTCVCFTYIILIEDAIMVLVINTSVYEILSSFCFKGSLEIVRRRILRATFA